MTSLNNTSNTLISGVKSSRTSLYSLHTRFKGPAGPSTFASSRPRIEKEESPPPPQGFFAIERPSRTGLRHGHMDVREGAPCGRGEPRASSGKKNKFGHFFVVVQLIHRLTRANTSSVQRQLACSFVHCLATSPRHEPREKVRPAPAIVSLAIKLFSSSSDAAEGGSKYDVNMIFRFPDPFSPLSAKN